MQVFEETYSMQNTITHFKQNRDILVFILSLSEKKFNIQLWQDHKKILRTE